MQQLYPKTTTLQPATMSKDQYLEKHVLIDFISKQIVTAAFAFSGTKGCNLACIAQHS